ncbi:MAG: GGDEF domain-containing protein [Actinomycetota bacterium]|nr:GGDEF domain-containing protein [Actinomycetota bacterium]
MALDDLNEVPHLAALMVDIDFFKKINDTFGHPAGDRVLERVARAITASTRSNDMAFRYGGEEFLVLLSQVEAATAVEAAERIRAHLRTSMGAGPEVKVSIGVAVRNVDEGASALVERADAALYRAKSNGRDQVFVSKVASPERELRGCEDG